MPTSAVGSSPLKARQKGFTLLELLVVVAIIAIASAGVAFALRDNSQTLLERDAARLAALFESARAQSRATGVPVRWRLTPEGFAFDGLPSSGSGALPSHWLGNDTVARNTAPVLLGPEPVIGRQEIVLQSISQPSQALRIATDGARPFTVQTVQAATP
ncbi:prepilin-type N-terminal cleavage/methylation domain-containing protein [Rhodoferax sp.]|uniref:prepilin-type N-terminal cleavage/methylation domain-containing protein n=1 Tax=Rhodoferax sp. TaxID=50421 RepID=UPI0025F53FAC|nr:prepilin-type N-terminal cleavage/methylation domain-containing protein [Rhodoferax sp.]